MVVQRGVSIGGKPARQARQPRIRLPVELQAACLSRFFVCLAGHRSSLRALRFGLLWHILAALVVFHGPYTYGTPAPAAKSAELNLLSTVVPVLIRRYALPTVIVLAVIIGIWVWASR